MSRFKPYEWLLGTCLRGVENPFHVTDGRPTKDSMFGSVTVRLEGKRYTVTISKPRPKVKPVPGATYKTR